MVFFSIRYVLKVRNNKSFKPINYLVYETLPSMFTTIGIFGTFLGIFVGLLDFNVDNIDASIPNLLSGLKTAFITSLLGLILSFLFSKITKSQIKKYRTDSSKELPELIFENTTIIQKNYENLNNNFERLLQSQENMLVIQKKFDGTIEKIYNEKFGNLEAKLYSLESIISKDLIKNNIEIIKNNLEFKHQQLIDKINEISKIIAESNTKSLVEVMKQATEEFNKQMSKLIERLVQENFEKLNQSVERMNSWQQENKDMITKLTNQFRQVSQDISNTSQSIALIVENTKKLTDENSVLTKIIQELKAVMIDDKKFQTIIDSVTYSIDLLKNTINEFSDNTSQLSKWTDNQRIFTENVNSLIKKLDEVKNVKDINEIFWKNLEQQLNDAVKIVKDANVQLKNNLDNLDEDFRRRLNETLNSLDQLIQRVMKKYDNTLT